MKSLQNYNNLQVNNLNPTSEDYKNLVVQMIDDFISYAQKKKILWDAISPSTLTSYAFLFHWYMSQGKKHITSQPVFLKDVYSLYKQYAESMNYEPIGKTLYHRQLEFMFDDIKTKKHCMGVQIMRGDEKKRKLKKEN